MMGKGAEGGCTRNSCKSVGTLPLSKGLVYSGSMSSMRGNVGQEWRSSDVFSQALKSLAIKPAFGELGTTALNSLLNTPISSENKRKQRTKKNDVHGALLRDSYENSWYKDLNGSPFWLLMEEYFREPTPEDIQLLVPKTILEMWTPCGSLDFLLQMPVSGVSDKVVVKRELSEEAQLPSALNLTHDHDVQSLRAVSFEQIAALQTSEQHEKATKRKLIASGSASKRRRLTCSTSDVVTAVISPPEHGDEDLCHVCYGGESNEKNQILFCDSCNVAVHQECYGVKAVPEEQWLCSMCRHRSNILGSTVDRDFHDCILCPVKGGALKLIALPKEQPCNEPTITVFGHLFCCQWIPETYIGDMEVMEPIMNVEGVREERWKFLCSICKEKYGACIQCSHGMCATAFHPLCARQAKLRMEVSSKANGDAIDMRAFCSKHTLLNGKPVLSIQTEHEIDYGSVHANVGIKNKSGSKKAGKKLKVAITRHRDDTVLEDAVADRDGTICKRETRINGGLNVNARKGQMRRPDSCVRNVDTIQTEKNGKILSDREAHEALESVQCWNPGLSCFSSMHKQTPSLVGKNVTKSCDEELKESNIDNKKEISCRSYRNKRRRVEQHTLVSQLRLEDNAQVPDNDCLRSCSPVENRDIQCQSSAGLENEYLQPTVSMPWDPCLEEVAINDEDRRLRGINGEASTSQDIVFTSQKTGPLPKLPTALKDQGDIGPISVPAEGKACRLDNQANIHPFLLTRLLKVQGSIAVRNSEIDTGKPCQLTDSLASTSLHVEGLQTKVSRSRRGQSKSYNRKRSLTLKSGKNRAGESLEAQIRQLEDAKKTGVLDMAPENELEEAILAAQLKLIVQAQGNRHQSEQLVLKIIPRLSKELRASRKKSRDLALVSQYLSMLREAKKQGRKERKSKEAQAVLAAATAVAAASSRLGALRKDGPASSNDEKPNFAARDSYCTPITVTSQSFGGYNAVRSTLRKPTSYGWTTSSQTSSCGKASSLDQDIKAFDSKNPGIEFDSGELRVEASLCDICKDPALPGPTIDCQRCKVVVHKQCYGVSSALLSNWLCQPCLEIMHQSQGLNVSDVTDRATPGHGVLCVLCFGLSGAFKRSADGKWSHVFCAQWFPEFSDKHEAGLHESTKMAALEKIIQECSVCRMKQGPRLRCSFGHCHGTFHPLCARDSGLYMSVKRSSGGRIQHRAYCEKHSAQQRQKAASKKYGSSDEWNVLLQMRAELERVRILCERVCKRERIKRDRLFCSLDLYKAHLSSLSSSAMASNDLSSTSNTFGTTVAFRKMPSLHPQQIDSMAARLPHHHHHHHGLESESLSWNSVAEGSKYQDSLSGDSVYQTQISCSEPSRETPARSQLTDAFHIQGRLNMSIGAVTKTGEQKRLGKHHKAETLHTEVVMTPTEASVQNQRLPKGYAYVPVGTLPKGKPNLSEASVLKDT